jgi:hypothetical protein
MLFVVWIYRQVFWCCRRIDNFLFSQVKKETNVSPSAVPWLFIGATLGDGKVVDYTCKINDAVEYGMTVTTEWLEIITGETSVSWKYLDAKTLEEKEFPSEGFVIDDSIESEPEDSADE